MKLSLLLLITVPLVNTGTVQGEQQMKKPVFSTIGIYVYPQPEKTDRYKFLKDCGYNYVEFCDTAFAWKPEMHEKYYQLMNDEIDKLHALGMKVGIIILSGMKQWQGPADSGNPGAFSPSDPAALNERYSYIEKSVTNMKTTDRFIFFAGDPGGDPNKGADVYKCIEMGNDVKKIVNKTAPGAQFSINLWAIA
jgi:hypothetical protein